MRRNGGTEGRVGATWRFLLDEFYKRTWFLIHQPANSPMFNINDSCLFPALSNAVSQGQGVFNKGSSSEAENLWTTDERSFYQYPRDKLALAYFQSSTLVQKLLSASITF